MPEAGNGPIKPKPPGSIRRTARQAEALRENLRKRKDQARARSGPAEPEPGEAESPPPQPPSRKLEGR